MRDKRLKKKSEIYFDKLARTQEVIEEPVMCYPIVLELLPPPCGKNMVFSVADIGCGTGEMLLRLQLKYQACQARIVGVDMSKESLDAAKKKCGDLIELFRADVENMPFPNDSFDILCCMHSFHHYPKPLSALVEMRRIMKPGGKLYLVENDFPEKARKKINIKLKLRGYPTGDIHMYSEEELKDLAGQGNLSVSFSEHIADHSRILICEKPVR